MMKASIMASVTINVVVAMISSMNQLNGSLIVINTGFFDLCKKSIRPSNSSLDRSKDLSKRVK